MKRRTSRLLSILLALCLALALLPGTALAKGKDDIAYPVTGGNIYFDPATGTVTDADYTITAAIIPSTINGVPVTTIGENAFDNCQGLTSLTILKGVTTIERSAFESCTSLTSVAIPDSVATIGPLAFSGCYNLTSVIIPDSVTILGWDAFKNCGLTSVTIPDSIASVAAFSFCHNLTSVTIPASVKTIGENAFSYCDNLTNITILGNMNSIGKRAFRDCDRLSSIILPDGVTTIGYEAFCSCDRLVSVTIPATVFTIGEGAFQNCYSLTDVYYGGSDSQWEQINIGALNNGLLTATIHYNGATPAPSASGSVSVTVNGKAVMWTDAAPFIDANNRTMVPLRAVADAMGLDVNWDAAARVASFTGSGKTIDFPIDSTNAITSSDGAVKLEKMDTAAVIVNDRTYAPIRYLAEYFGYTVGWDAATRTVTITG